MSSPDTGASRRRTRRARRSSRDYYNNRRSPSLSPGLLPISPLRHSSRRVRAAALDSEIVERAGRATRKTRGDEYRTAAPIAAEVRKASDRAYLYTGPSSSRPVRIDVRSRRDHRAHEYVQTLERPYSPDEYAVSQHSDADFDADYEFDLHLEDVQLLQNSQSALLSSETTVTGAHSFGNLSYLQEKSTNAFNDTVTTLAVKEAKYPQDSFGLGSVRAVLTEQVPSPGLTTKPVYKWIHINSQAMTFHSFAAQILQNDNDILLSDFDKQDIGVLLQRIRESFESIVPDSRGNQGKSMSPFLKDQITDHDLKNVPASRVTVLSLPFFQLKTFEGTSIPSTNVHPVQTLLQTRYPYVQKIRDTEEQAICQLFPHLRKSQLCYHVPELWLFVMDQKLIVSCSNMSREKLTENLVTTQPPKDERQQIVFISDGGRKLWSFPLDQCRTWLEFVAHFNEVTPEFGKYYKLSTKKGLEVSNLNWAQVVSGSRQLSLHFELSKRTLKDIWSLYSSSNFEISDKVQATDDSDSRRQSLETFRVFDWLVAVPASGPDETRIDEEAQRRVFREMHSKLATSSMVKDRYRTMQLSSHDEVLEWLRSQRALYMAVKHQIEERLKLDISPAQKQIDEDIILKRLPNIFQGSYVASDPNIIGFNTIHQEQGADADQPTMRTASMVPNAEGIPSQTVESISVEDLEPRAIAREIDRTTTLDAPIHDSSPDSDFILSPIKSASQDNINEYFEETEKIQIPSSQWIDPPPPNRGHRKRRQSQGSPFNASKSSIARIAKSLEHVEFSLAMIARLFSHLQQIFDFFMLRTSTAVTGKKFWGSWLTYLKRYLVRGVSVFGECESRTPDVRGIGGLEHIGELASSISRARDLLSDNNAIHAGHTIVPIEFCKLWMILVASAVTSSGDEEKGSIEDDFDRTVHIRQAMSKGAKLMQQGLRKMFSNITDVSLSESEMVLPTGVISLILRRIVQDISTVPGNNELASTYDTYISNLELAVDANPYSRSHQQSLSKVRQEIVIISNKLDDQIHVVGCLAEILSEEQGRLDFKAEGIIFPRAREVNVLQETLALVHGKRKSFEIMLLRVDELAEQNLRMIENNKDRQESAILVFTIVTVIFLPLSFVASYCAVIPLNFHESSNMQWLYWAIAVPFTIVVLLIVLYWAGELGNVSSSVWTFLRKGRGLLKDGPKDGGDVGISERDPIVIRRMENMSYAAPPRRRTKAELNADARMLGRGRYRERGRETRSRGDGDVYQ